MRIDLSNKWSKVLGIILTVFIIMFAFKLLGFVLSIVFHPVSLVLIAGGGFYFYKKNKNITFKK